MKVNFIRRDELAKEGLSDLKRKQYHKSVAVR